MAKTILVLGEPHHNTESQRPNRVGVVDVPEGQDSSYAGLVALWQAGGCYPEGYYELFQPPTQEQYQQLLAEGRLSLRLVPLDEESADDNCYVVFYLDATDRHLVWTQASGPADQWGEKWTATHLRVRDWEPNQEEVRKLLQDHSQEELAVLLLRERTR
jgi:hypothetical protein